MLKGLELNIASGSPSGLNLQNSNTLILSCVWIRGCLGVHSEDTAQQRGPSHAQHLDTEGPILYLGHSQFLTKKGLRLCGNVQTPLKQQVGRGGYVHPCSFKEVRVLVWAVERTRYEGFETQAMQIIFCIFTFARIQKLTGAAVNI